MWTAITILLLAVGLVLTNIALFDLTRRHEKRLDLLQKWCSSLSRSHVQHALWLSDLIGQGAEADDPDVRERYLRLKLYADEGVYLNHEDFAWLHGEESEHAP